MKPTLKNSKMTSSNKQPVHGILLLNKPQGVTSNWALQKVKRLFNAQKAGHTGSLDPLATGMLPICFGEATKFSQYLLDADKCYEVTAALGIKTNTGDALGEIIARVEGRAISQDDLHEVLQAFLGKSKQVPSMFSALKHQGRPLYEYARAGVEVEREARDIYIHQLSLVDFDARHFSLVVSCSKGTYIRNLIEDIGNKLGVGAHVTRLHRKYTAGFADEPMHALNDLAEQSKEALLNCLLPIDRATAFFPRMTIEFDEESALRQGKIIKIQPENNCGIMRLYRLDGRFVGLGEVDESGHLKGKRLLQGVY